MKSSCFVSPATFASKLGTRGSDVCVSYRRSSRSAARKVSPQIRSHRMSPRCLEETPTEQLAWVDAMPVTYIEPGQLTSQILCGLDILIVCAYDGQVYALGNKGTPLGVPLVGGSVSFVDGSSYLKCPQYGTLYDLSTGEVKDKASWVPYPPLLRNVVRLLFPEPQGIPSFLVRENKGNLQVLLNTNARAEYETRYWKAILDASGKADGGYY